MPDKEDEELERVHLWLFKSDVEWVRQYFGGNIKMSKAIRTMVRKFRKQIEAKAGADARPTPIDTSTLSADDLLRDGNAGESAG